MGNIMKKITVIITIMVFALTVFADQAAYIHKNDSFHALALLKYKKEIRHFCKPCGDTTYRAEEIRNIEAAPVNYENYWELRINGAGVDLAYVYYIDADGKWRNVANRINLKVSDVPKYLPDDMN